MKPKRSILFIVLALSGNLGAQHDACRNAVRFLVDDQTEKAVELVKMSIARARLLEPLEGTSLAVDQSALVVGGGLSGMTAALSLAEQGFKVHLAEQTNTLGGHLAEIYRTLEHDNISDFTTNLIRRVESHSNIDLYM